MRRSPLLLLVCLANCGGRTLAGEADDDTTETGLATTETAGEQHPCAGPNPPTGIVELVAGQMQPKTFVPIGPRIYWADGWDEWADADASTTVYRTDAATDAPWVTVASEQPGVNQMIGLDGAVFWVVEGLGQAEGALLRADADDQLVPLDGGLVGPRALTSADGWLFYADSGGLDQAGAKILRIRPDGSDRRQLADSFGQITDIAVNETHVWWSVMIRDEVWRVSKQGGDAELVATDAPFPHALEIRQQDAWTLGVIGLYRVVPGLGSEFITGHSGPHELAVDSTHAYVAWWTLPIPEETRLGFITRYPLDDPELDSLATEFVVDDVRPRPQAVRVDALAVYWSTADEDSGAGSISMLCKSAL